MTKPKSPLRVYSSRDRQAAARILSEARALLHEGKKPFPTLEAARRVGVQPTSPIWELVVQAREAVGGGRDDRQLEAAAALVREDNNTTTSRAPTPRLTRVPRCRLRAAGGRCGRPIAHGRGCSTEPPPDDLVRSVGTDHVLLGGPPTDTTLIIAWETGTAGKSLRVRRDDHDRGLWIDCPTEPRRSTGAPILLGWAEVQRLVLDLNLELADHRGSPRSAR